MREIYEYTAEVRQIIAQKKEAQRQNRRRILTGVTSLALILVIGTAAFLPGILQRAAEQTPDAWMGTEGLEGDQRTEDAWTGNECLESDQRTEAAPQDQETLPLSLCSAELWRLAQDGQWIKSGEQPKDPDGVTAWILTVDPFAFESMEGFGTDELTETASEREPVRIVLTDDSGAKADYLYNGTELIKLSENQRILLTDEQIAELNALLFDGD